MPKTRPLTQQQKESASLAKRTESIQNMLKHQMVDAKIASVPELADRCGLDQRTLYYRLKEPHKLKLAEIAKLDSVLHFGPEEKLMFLSF